MLTVKKEKVKLKQSDKVLKDLSEYIIELKNEKDKFLKSLTKDKSYGQFTDQERYYYNSVSRDLNLYINSLTAIVSRFNYIAPIIDILYDNKQIVNSVIKSVTGIISSIQGTPLYCDRNEGYWTFSDEKYLKPLDVVNQASKNNSHYFRADDKSFLFKFQVSKLPTCCGAAVLSDIYVTIDNKGILQKIYPHIEKLITGKLEYCSRYSYLIMTDRDREVTKHVAKKLGFNITDTFFNINSSNEVNVFTKIIKR